MRRPAGRSRGSFAAQRWLRTLIAGMDGRRLPRRRVILAEGVGIALRRRCARHQSASRCLRCTRVEAQIETPDNAMHPTITAP